MTTGVGFSVGSVNSVSASVTDEQPWPSVRVRRTAVTFDAAGTAKVGGIPQFTMAATDFADLGSDPESMIVGGQLWSPANLIAAVVNSLLDAGDDAPGTVLTYPAHYSDKQFARLRQALDLSGARDVLLMPEPVAAAEWLEHEHGPLEPGFLLVYDLGGTSLDVSIVRVGPDWDHHPVVGKPQRSYDFGGRPLGAMIARYAAETPDATADGEVRTNIDPVAMPSIVDIDALRTSHIRDSFDIVRECLQTTGLALSDMGRVLLVGGASRPAEVARTLAELGRPVVMSADPGHTVAAGAAYYAARTMAPADTGGHHGAPRFAVVSSAAFISALAMSTVTVFGGPADYRAAPLLEHFPGTTVPADTVLDGPSIGNPSGSDRRSSRRGSGPSLASGVGAPGQSGYDSLIGGTPYERMVAPMAHTTTFGPPMAESYLGGGRGSDDRCLPVESSDVYFHSPAHFANPLPFTSHYPLITGPDPAPAPEEPDASPTVPEISLPDTPPPPADDAAPPISDKPPAGEGIPDVGIPDVGAPDMDDEEPNQPDVSDPTSPEPGTTQPGPDPTNPDPMPSDGSASNEDTEGGGPSENGGPASGEGGGGTSNDGPAGGGVSGGSPSGGGDSGAGGSGGATSGGGSGGSSSGDSSGGSASGGSDGGASSGGASGGSASGGSDGGSFGGPSSRGGASGGSTGGASSAGDSSSGASSGGFSSGGSGRSSGGSRSGGGGGRSGGSGGR